MTYCRLKSTMILKALEEIRQAQSDRMNVPTIDGLLPSSPSQQHA